MTYVEWDVELYSVIGQSCEGGLVNDAAPVLALDIT